MNKTLLLTICTALCTSVGFSQSAPLTSLNDYLQTHAVRNIEGNIGKYPGKVEFFSTLIRSNTAIQSIAEIGFNAGHSSDIFLSASPSCTVVSFDIMEHNYANVGKKYIDLRYPGRHTLISGDSLISVPKYVQQNPNKRFDLIFIDGGHSFSVAYSDIVNMQSLASPTTIVIVDDLHYPAVLKAWKQCCLEGRVQEVKRHSTQKTAWGVGSYVFKKH